MTASPSRRAPWRRVRWRYPGNIGELKNIVERAACSSTATADRLRHLPPALAKAGPEIVAQTAQGNTATWDGSLRSAVQQYESGLHPEPASRSGLVIRAAPPSSCRSRAVAWSRSCNATRSGILRDGRRMSSLIKPRSLAVLTKTERRPAGASLILSAFGMFDLQSPDPLRFEGEQALWLMVAKELPPGRILDLGLPKPTAEVLVAGHAGGREAPRCSAWA